MKRKTTSASPEDLGEKYPFSKRLCQQNECREPEAKGEASDVETSGDDLLDAEPKDNETQNIPRPKGSTKSETKKEFSVLSLDLKSIKMD